MYSAFAKVSFLVIVLLYWLYIALFAFVYFHIARGSSGIITNKQTNINENLKSLLLHKRIDSKIEDHVQNNGINKMCVVATTKWDG